MSGTDSEIRLVCFPYAGASAGVYAKWKRRLPSWIRVIAADLPGHGRRFGEPLEQDIARLTADALHTFARELAPPFALFGHSLGAVLAFELGVALAANGVRPLALFASGSPAPSLRDPDRYARVLASGDLKAELLALKGTSQEAIEDAELMDLVLPVLRADFQVCASYRCTAERRVTCPLHVFVGDEEAIEPHTVDGWRTHTSSTCSIDMLPGNHFFIHTQEARLLRLIQTHVTRAARERQLQNASSRDAGDVRSQS